MSSLFLRLKSFGEDEGDLDSPMKIRSLLGKLGSFFGYTARSLFGKESTDGLRRRLLRLLALARLRRLFFRLERLGEGSGASPGSMLGVPIL